MDNTVVYIKCISGSDPLKQAYKSYDEKKHHFYNLNAVDEENLKNIDKPNSHYIVFIEYKESEIKTMLIGSFNWQRNSAPRNDSLKYNITNIIDSEIIIKNIAKLSELDLTEDFKESKYVMFEDGSGHAEWDGHDLGQIDLQTKEIKTDGSWTPMPYESTEYVKDCFREAVEEKAIAMGAKLKENEKTAPETEKPEKKWKKIDEDFGNR